MKKEYQQPTIEILHLSAEVMEDSMWTINTSDSHAQCAPQRHEPAF